MDETLASILKAIAAYSIPVQSRAQGLEGSPGEEGEEAAKMNHLVKELQTLVQENDHLRNTLHSHQSPCPKSSKSREVESPNGKSSVQSSNDQIARSQVFSSSYFSFLQNQVNFLQMSLKNSETQFPTQPVFLVQAEFFLLMKETLWRSLGTIELFLALLDEEDECVYQEYAGLKTKVRDSFLQCKFDTAFLYQLFSLVQECEGVKEGVHSLYQRKIEQLSGGMTQLLHESYQMIPPLASGIKDSSHLNEIKSWNERKIEISSENCSMHLLICKKEMLEDLEHLKQYLLTQKTGLSDFFSTKIPTCPPRLVVSQRLPKPSSEDRSVWSRENQQMLLYLSTEISLQISSLNSAKSIICAWAWRPSPLFPSPEPVIKNMHELVEVVKSVTLEIDSIAKVAKADKDFIEERVQRTHKEDRLETRLKDLSTEIEARKVRETQLEEENERLKDALQRLEHSELTLEATKRREMVLLANSEEQRKEIRRLKDADQLLQASKQREILLNAEIAKLREVKESHQSANVNLEEANSKLSSDLTIFRKLYEDLKLEVDLFIRTANLKVFHGAADSLSEIEVEIEELDRVHQESIEVQVMETFEPPLLPVGRGKKLKVDGSETEEMWKGMAYLTTAAARVACVCEPHTPMTVPDAAEIDSQSMKFMQHKLYEDLKFIEDNIRRYKTELEELSSQGREMTSANSEKDVTIKGLKQVLDDQTLLQKQELAKAQAKIQKQRGEIETLNKQRQSQEKVVQQETTAKEQSMKLAQANHSQIKAMEKRLEMLNQQINAQTIHLSSAKMSQGVADQSDYVMKGTGSGLETILSKSLTYEIHLLSKLLTHEIDVPENIIDKQTVISTLLQELKQFFADQQTEFERLKTDLVSTKKTLEESGQTNSSLIEETKRLREQLQAQELVVSFDNKKEEERTCTGSRLQTTGSIEEKLIKGLEYTCIRAKAITGTRKPLPEDLLEKQRFLYQGLEEIEKIITELRNTERSLKETNDDLGKRLKSAENEFLERDKQHTIVNRDLSHEIEKLKSEALAQEKEASDRLGTVQREAEELQRSLEDHAKALNQSLDEHTAQAERKVNKLQVEVTSLKKQLQSETAAKEMQIKLYTVSQSQVKVMGKRIEMLNQQLNTEAIKVGSSKMSPDVTDKSDNVMKGTGSGLETMLSKSLTYEIHLLSSLLHHEEDVPGNLIDKQTVISSLLQELKQFFADQANQRTTLEKTLEETQKSNSAFKEEVNRLREQTQVQELVILTDDRTAEEGSAGSRLQANGSIEEKLLKGFEYICTRAKAITGTSEELPTDHLEKQRFLYQRLEDIERMLADLRQANVELENRLKTAENAFVEKENQLMGTINDLESEIKKLKSEALLREKEMNDRLETMQRESEETQRSLNYNISALEQQLADLTKSTENEKTELKRGFELERKQGEKELEDFNRQQIQLMEEQKKRLEETLIQVRVNTPALHPEKEDFPREHEESPKHLEAVDAEIASSQQQAANLNAQVQVRAEDLTNLIGAITKELREKHEENAKLRSRLAEVETEVYMTSEVSAPIQPDNCMKPLKQVDFGDKIKRGCNHLIRKIAGMIPHDAEVPDNLLDKQLVMHKLLRELERVVENARNDKGLIEKELDEIKAEKATLTSKLETHYTEKAEDTKQINSKVSKLSDEIAKLKASKAALEESNHKLETALSDANNKLTILKQTYESELKILRSQIEIAVVDLTEHGSPRSDETPRKHLQSGGSIGSNLDKGFDLILALAAPVTHLREFPVANLLDKQKAVFENVKKLVAMVSPAINIEAENKALREQLSMQEVKIGQEIDPPSEENETRSHLQAGDTQSEKLAKGFDYSIKIASNLLGRPSNPPEAMLDKQRVLFDLIQMLADQNKQIKSQISQASFNTFPSNFESQVTNTVAALEIRLEKVKEAVKFAYQKVSMERSKLHKDLKVCLDNAYALKQLTETHTKLEETAKREKMELLKESEELNRRLSELTKAADEHLHTIANLQTDISKKDESIRQLESSTKQKPMKRDLSLLAQSPNVLQDHIQKQEQIQRISQLQIELDNERDEHQKDVAVRNSEIQKRGAVEEQLIIAKDENAKLAAAVTVLQAKLTALMEVQGKPTDEDAPKSDTYMQLQDMGNSLKELIDKMQEGKHTETITRLRKIVLNCIYPGLTAHFQRWRNNCVSVQYADEQLYAEDSLQVFKLDLVRNNPILLRTATKGRQPEKPMPDFMVLKLASEILLEKVETDIKEGETSLPEFTFTYLTGKYGSVALALKQLQQMIPTLWGFNTDEYYGHLLARLFQIKNPFNDSLVSFLVKANFEMQKLVLKRIENKRSRAQSAHEKVHDNIDPASGGIILLSDALSLIYALGLDAEERVGRRIISYLRDEGMDKVDFVAFVISHRMKVMGISPGEFFKSIEQSDRGVPIETLIRVITERLNLRISAKKLRTAFREKFDRNRSGKVGKEEFSVYIDMAYYELNAVHDSYSVERNYFLYILSFVYDRMVEERINNIKDVFESMVSAPAEESFQKSLEAINISVSPEKLSDLILTAGEFHPDDPYSLNNFLYLLARKNVGECFVKPFSKIHSAPEAVQVETHRKRKRNEIKSQAIDKSILNFARRHNTMMGLDFK